MIAKKYLAFNYSLDFNLPNLQKNEKELRNIETKQVYTSIYATVIIHILGTYSMSILY